MNYKAKEMVSDERLDNLIWLLSQESAKTAREEAKHYLGHILEAAYAKGRDDERARCAAICFDMATEKYNNQSMIPIGPTTEYQAALRYGAAGLALDDARHSILEPNTKEG